MTARTSSWLNPSRARLGDSAPASTVSTADTPTSVAEPVDGEAAVTSATDCVVGPSPHRTPPFSRRLVRHSHLPFAHARRGRRAA